VVLAAVVALALHLLILWLGVSDLVALLLFAAPISAYLAYCTHRSRASLWRSALSIYLTFSSVVIAAAGLVYLIG
jgi:hypothetical protein